MSSKYNKVITMNRHIELNRLKWYFLVKTLMISICFCTLSVVPKDLLCFCFVIKKAGEHLLLEVEVTVLESV